MQSSFMRDDVSSSLTCSSQNTGFHPCNLFFTKFAHNNNDVDDTGVMMGVK